MFFFAFFVILYSQITNRIMNKMQEEKDKFVQNIATKNFKLVKKCDGINKERVEIYENNDGFKMVLGVDALNWGEWAVFGKNGNGVIQVGRSFKSFILPLPVITFNNK